MEDQNNMMVNISADGIQQVWRELREKNSRKNKGMITVGEVGEAAPGDGGGGGGTGSTSTAASRTLLEMHYVVDAPNIQRMLRKEEEEKGEKLLLRNISAISIIGRSGADKDDSNNNMSLKKGINQKSSVMIATDSAAISSATNLPSFPMPASAFVSPKANMKSLRLLAKSAPVNPNPKTGRESSKEWTLSGASHICHSPLVPSAPEGTIVFRIYLADEDECTLNGPFCSITTNFASCMYLRRFNTVRSNHDPYAHRTASSHPQQSGQIGQIGGGGHHKHNHTGHHHVFPVPRYLQHELTEVFRNRRKLAKNAVGGGSPKAGTPKAGRDNNIGVGSIFPPMYRAQLSPLDPLLGYFSEFSLQNLKAVFFSSPPSSSMSVSSSAPSSSAPTTTPTPTPTLPHFPAASVRFFKEMLHHDQYRLLQVLAAYTMEHASPISRLIFPFNNTSGSDPHTNGHTTSGLYGLSMQGLHLLHSRAANPLFLMRYMSHAENSPKPMSDPKGLTMSDPKGLTLDDSANNQIGRSRTDASDLQNRVLPIVVWVPGKHPGLYILGAGAGRKASKGRYGAGAGRKASIFRKFTLMSSPRGIIVEVVLYGL